MSQHETSPHIEAEKDRHRRDITLAVMHGPVDHRFVFAALDTVAPLASAGEIRRGTRPRAST